jgi:aminoglycoside phosphotransferase (APT) family kinase protein
VEALVPAQKMHADEVETDASLVRRLLAEQCPKWADLPIQPVAERGTDNILYRLGDELVARLPGRERPELALRKECAWLPKLTPLLPLDVPLPMAVGRPAEGYPYEWAVFRWLDGEPATPERLGDLRRAAEDLAGFVAALQRVDTTGGPGPGEHNVYRGCPLALREETTRASLAKLAGEVDTAAVTELWEEALAAPEWDRPPVWIHGDLDSRNLLVRHGRLSAVLDFGCLGVGDPACEAMVVWKLLDAEGRAIFRSALSIDDATWTRARGWAASQAVVALAYYTLDTNPVLVREARRWLAELLG